MLLIHYTAEICCSLGGITMPDTCVRKKMKAYHENKALTHYYTLKFVFSYKNRLQEYTRS